MGRFDRCIAMGVNYEHNRSEPLQDKRHSRTGSQHAGDASDILGGGRAYPSQIPAPFALAGARNVSRSGYFQSLSVETVRVPALALRLSFGLHDPSELVTTILKKLWCEF